MWGLLFGVLSIILGAFGAHALRAHLSSDQLASFETGIRYQMYHGLLLILLANFKFLQSKLIFGLYIAGIFFFSFSIYLLNLRGLMGIESLKYLGPITPIGGLLLILAWLILMVKVFKHQTGN